MLDISSTEWEKGPSWHRSCHGRPGDGTAFTCVVRGLSFLLRSCRCCQAGRAHSCRDCHEKMSLIWQPQGSTSIGQRCHTLQARQRIPSWAAVGGTARPDRCPGCAFQGRRKVSRIFSPGPLSASVTMPLCSRPTASTSDRPSPDPGLPRAGSSRPKRFRAAARLSAGFPDRCRRR